MTGSTVPITLPRRALLQAMAALAAAPALAGEPTSTRPTTIPRGKPGEFDFLAGSWTISHRRLKAPGVWDEFKGEATCWTILGGVGSVEELRVPARDFSGMGLRLLDVKNGVWADHWVNAKGGVMTAPGVLGGFTDGVGIFESDEEDEQGPLKARGVWDRITKTSCRWSQATSRDGGKTWDVNWSMDWTRVA